VATGSFVAYYRTSTAKRSLGGEDQCESVADSPTAASGSSWARSRSTNPARPTPARLLREPSTSATARVPGWWSRSWHRLSRDVQVITGLQKSRVSFVCADMPEMDEFTDHIFAAMAQRERRLISARTHDGFAALKVVQKG
jgi:DNA invertase Pin-like site-specific DNA recombinase